MKKYEKFFQIGFAVRMEWVKIKQTERDMSVKIDLNSPD